MQYCDLINGMKRFGSTETDICLHGIGITPDKVKESVIIAPWWEPSSLPKLGDADFLSASEYESIKVWNIRNGEKEFTYIKTGIGAPVLMDAVLSLGVTKCKRAIFIGSVGSLDEKIGIGDIVIPKFSVCGDGASRYISVDTLAKSDVFGTRVEPNKQLFDDICNVTHKICSQNDVRYHIGSTFSIDTVFAQFAHIDEILNMGCNVIEMETAAAFRAAKVASIPIVALFSVSDNTITNKSLISGRTVEERQYRNFVRKTLFPEIILSVL